MQIVRLTGSSNREVCSNAPLAPRGVFLRFAPLPRGNRHLGKHPGEFCHSESANHEGSTYTSETEILRPPSVAQNEKSDCPAALYVPIALYLHLWYHSLVRPISPESEAL
jgi:hypothetical protein